MTSFMARLGQHLVANGYPIIPIEPGTKRPGRHVRGSWSGYPAWSRHALRATTEQEIEVWSSWPDAGIGIVCGQVIGVDIDIEDDAELAQRIENLARERLGDTPALRIGRVPKRLLVYRASEPFKGMKAPPIEILGLGQQFVAYAVHPDTKRPYDWPDESLADIEITRLPAVNEGQAQAFLDEAAALVPAAKRPARLAGARSKRQDNAAPPPSTPLAGTLPAVRAALAHVPNADLAYDDWVRVGLALKGALGDDGAALFEAWSAQSAKNEPAFTAKTWAGFAPRSIGAGTIYHLAMERGWKPEAELVLDGTANGKAEHPAAALIAKIDAGTTPSAPAEPVAAAAPPAHLYELDGALRLFVNYIVTTAIRPQPWLAIGASLAALGTIMGRRYRTHTNLRSNLYVLAMASSGSGKDHARNCIKEAFLAAGLSHHLGGNRLVSGAGLLSALYRQPASLFQLDEFGQFLAQIVDKRRAPKHLSEIWDLLTELSTSAGNTFLGAEYADQREQPRQDIVQPCCCIHATTVPDPLWAALRHGSLQDGSLARFLVFRSPDDIPDRNLAARPIDEVPAELIQALRTIAAGMPSGRNLTAIAAPVVKPAPYTIPLEPDAAALFRGLDAEMTERQRRAVGSGRDAILARVWENTAKLAMIKAVSAAPEAPVVRLADAEWARAVVAHCVATMFDQAERHLADNEIERNHKRVLEIIRAEGTGGITRKNLYDRTRFLSRRDREDILATLVESERVTEIVRPTATKPVTIYRAGGGQ